MTLVMRRATYHRVRAETRKVSVMFRALRSPIPFGYFLTDHPAVAIPYRRVGAIGPMLLPLSHDVMLIQVPLDLAAEFFGSLKPTLEWLTLLQMRVGAAVDLLGRPGISRLCGRCVVRQTEWAGRGMRRWARLPFFGFGEPSELASMWAESGRPSDR